MRAAGILPRVGQLILQHLSHPPPAICFAVLFLYHLTHGRRRRSHFISSHLIGTRRRVQYLTPTSGRSQLLPASICASTQRSASIPGRPRPLSSTSRPWLLSPRPTLVHAQYDRTPRFSCVCVCNSFRAHITCSSLHYITLHRLNPSQNLPESLLPVHRHLFRCSRDVLIARNSSTAPCTTSIRPRPLFRLPAVQFNPQSHPSCVRLDIDIRSAS